MAVGTAIRDDLVERIARVAEASGTGGVNIIPAVLSGSPVRAIADYTGRVAADLVVVGKKARRGSGYWSAGSFAAALGKAVKSPTIAVPSDDPRAGRVGRASSGISSCAIDFSEVSLRALSEALVLAQQSGGHLRLLHVLDGFPYETVYSGSRGVSPDARFPRACRAGQPRAAVVDPTGRVELERDRGGNGIRPGPRSDRRGSVRTARRSGCARSASTGAPGGVRGGIDGAQSPSSHDVACASCARSGDGESGQVRGRTR